MGFPAALRTSLGYDKRTDHATLVSTLVSTTAHGY
jgi:hypothetical protein